MKKIFVFILIFLIFLFSNAYVASKRNMKINEEEEIRGVYISYLEYLTYFAIFTATWYYTFKQKCG